MQNELLVALIAPVAALLGVLSSPVVSFLLGKFSHKSSQAESVRKNRQLVYSEFMNCMHDYIQKKDSDSFTQFFKAYANLTLIGSPDVVCLVEEYLREQLRKAFTREAHKTNQEKIMNAMRKDMDLPESDPIAWLPIPILPRLQQKENKNGK